MTEIKAAIVILAGTETHEGLARAVNALEAAKEFKNAGDEVQLIFDGAGVTWLPRLEDPGHDLHELYAAVRDQVTGVCDYCANAFGVHEAVQSCGAPLTDEFEGHPSFRTLIDNGYHIITF